MKVKAWPDGSGMMSIRLRSRETTPLSWSSGEKMECERWGADEEVEMDVDLSVEEELHLLSELSHTRGKLAVSVPPTLLPAAASAPSQYTVSCLL